MSLASLSINQVLDIWKELEQIWYERLDDDNPTFAFALYAYRVIPFNPSVQAGFEKNGPDFASWSKHLFDPESYQKPVLEAWGAVGELIEKFEKSHSTDDYSCEIFINGRKADSGWMGSEMLEIWQCELEICYVFRAVPV